MMHEQAMFPVSLCEWRTIKEQTQNLEERYWLADVAQTALHSMRPVKIYCTFAAQVREGWQEDLLGYSVKGHRQQTQIAFLVLCRHHVVNVNVTSDWKSLRLEVGRLNSNVLTSDLVSNRTRPSRFMITGCVWLGMKLNTAGQWPSRTSQAQCSSGIHIHFCSVFHSN